MNRPGRLLIFCLMSASLVAVARAEELQALSRPRLTELSQERLSSDDNLSKPPQTPRKRRPYDPELQPPEGSTTKATTSADARISSCLPPEIGLDNAVANELVNANQSPKLKLTVRTRLAQLKGRCSKGKLVDGKGRQIRFYTLIGCWGNPPADYLEMLDQQAREIKRLKKRYTVIQISCAQSIDPASIN